MNQVSIGSDKGLSPIRRQAIIWTNAGILLIEPLGTKFSEILIEIHTFSFKKMHLEISSAKWRPFCPGGDELTLTLTKSLTQMTSNGQTLNRKHPTWCHRQQVIIFGNYLRKITVKHTARDDIASGNVNANMIFSKMFISIQSYCSIDYKLTLLCKVTYIMHHCNLSWLSKSMILLKNIICSWSYFF